MKKVILVSAVLLIFAGLVSAPVAAATKVNFGLKAGVSLSNNAWSDDDGTEKILVRPTFGVFAVFNLTPMLAIQPEVNYLVMGEWWGSDSLKIVEAFTYIHIPVLLKVRLMKEGKIIPALFAGPAIGFLLSAKEAGDDVKSFFKDTDFGADFGLGAEMAAGKMKVVFDARFYLGLTNAFSRPAIVMALAPTDFTMKNRAFSLTVGVIF